jgi:hypothetical protein
MEQTFKVTVAGVQSHIETKVYENQTVSQVLSIWEKHTDIVPLTGQLFSGDFIELNSSYNICVEED